MCGKARILYNLNILIYLSIIILVIYQYNYPSVILHKIFILVISTPVLQSTGGRCAPPPPAQHVRLGRSAPRGVVIMVIVITIMILLLIIIIVIHIMLVIIISIVIAQHVRFGRSAPREEGGGDCTHHSSGQRRVPISRSILSAACHASSLTVLDSLIPSPRPAAMTSGETNILKDKRACNILRIRISTLK